jgi:tetratricopeptide (TPR) repeat protein
MERGRYLEAAADFLNAINIAEGVRYPNVYNSYAMRGDALRRAGRYEDSVKEFSKAIRLNPQPNYYYHRGLSLRALGKNIEAADDFVVAGNNAEAVVWLGSR